MGFSYLKNKYWSDLSREERYYCAVLYKNIRSDMASFLKCLELNTPLKMSSIAEWEVGYEVCFYRDFLKHHDEDVKRSAYSEKRTFDLCLFSESNILIIETKVQQPFHRKQLNEIKSDKMNVRNILQEHNYAVPQIDLLAITSSKYLKNLKQYGHYALLDLFGTNILTWRSIGEYYKEELFLTADALYKK